MQRPPVRMIQNRRQMLRLQRRRRRQALLGSLLAVNLCLFCLLIYAAVQGGGGGGGGGSQTKEQLINQGMSTIKRIGMTGLDALDLWRTKDKDELGSIIRDMRVHADKLNRLGEKLQSLDPREPWGYIFCVYRYVLDNDEAGLTALLDRGLRATPSSIELLMLKKQLHLKMKGESSLTSAVIPTSPPVPARLPKSTVSTLGKDRLIREGVRLMLGVDERLEPLTQPETAVEKALGLLKSVEPQGRRLSRLGQRIQVLDPGEAAGYLFSAYGHLIDLDLKGVNAVLDKGLIACPSDPNLLEARQEMDDAMDLLVEAS